MASFNPIETVPTPNLLNLIPEKFTDSQLLIDFMSEVSTLIGEYLNNVNEMQLLQDPNNVPIAYLKYLGKLIGVTLPDVDTTSEKELRREVLQAIDWYKIKGTYHAMQIIISASGLTVNLYDMYTNDYVTFSIQDWFVGEEDENPTGLDSSYYKSPHFGFEILLIIVHNTDALGDHLWRDALFTNVDDRIEKVRPINTVPHYWLLLNPLTDESGTAIESLGKVFCKVTENWSYDKLYFDTGESGHVFDTGDPDYLFDIDIESFLDSIVTWKLGTG